MIDLKITDLSKTEEEGNVDFISLTNEQWSMIKTNIELIKNYEKCELMYVEDFKKNINEVRADAIEECIAEINRLKMKIVYPHTICNILEQLKENKNEV